MGKVKILFCVSVTMCILCLDFVSCKKKSVPNGYQNKNTPAKEFVFSITEYHVNGFCEEPNPAKYYVSKNAINFLICHYPDKGKMTVNADIYFPYKRGLLESHGFYIDSSDLGDWIEDCLIAYEEERLAKVFEEAFEIESPVDGYEEEFDFFNDYEENDEHIDLSEDVIVEDDFSIGTESEEEKIESVEKRLLDSNARLRMLMFEDEIFIPEPRFGEQVLISADGKKVRRSFYDDKYRLLKREYWTISGLENSVIEKSEEYKYEDKNLSPIEKSITTSDTTIKTYFNANGAAKKSETYKYAEAKDNSGKKEEKVQYLKYSVEWQYDKDGKLASESTATYEYKNDNYLKPSKIYRKRQTYKYHDDDEIPPDYAYYEDGKLRIKTIYTSKDEYRTDTFFESGYTISAYYKDSKKMREVYYQNGAAVRTKNYE